MTQGNTFLKAGALALMTAGLAAPSHALTVTISNSTGMTLSQAVAMVHASDDDGPDVINIEVNSITDADGQVLITKPLVINGDAENAGLGDGTACDVLVDMIGIEGAFDVGSDGRKGYIEIQSEGLVEINDLRIHPNADGTLGTHAEAVSGIRMLKPETGEVGEYNLTNVHVSGSDLNNSMAFVPLDTGADLYNTAGIAKWGGFANQNDGNIAGHAAIQMANGGGDGVYNSTLQDVHAGLSYGAALNIPIEGGTINVFGGVFGHCARDGIRVSGTGVTIQGTANDRVRIVRNTNIGGANSHGVEIVAGGEILLMEYVDVASMETANNFSFRNGHLQSMRYCRGMGKFQEDAVNQTVFINTGNITIDLIEDCTFHGDGQTSIPLAVQATVIDPFEFQDTIFTSQGLGPIQNNASTGTVTYTNCAIPTDNFLNESLSDPPFVGVGGPVEVDSIYESPQYALTLDDYDWSDNQGAGIPGNGPGNANVFRPTNASYLTASSTNGPLVGGAGPALASVGDMWMLME